jgi:RecB family exonuclease
MLTEVTVPASFYPSALDASARCRLKLIIASTRRADWNERLASGPEAMVGTLLHRVLERVARGGGLSPDEVFREEYANAVDELRRDPRRAHFADLASTKSLAEWNRAKHWILARAPQHLGPLIPKTTAAGGQGLTRRTGTEVLFESATLRLRGKADSVRQLGPREFEVRDFKTGVVLDQRGEVKPEIALQLWAYAFMLLELRPGCDVRLIVDDGAEHEVAFDVRARARAKVILDELLGKMPPAGRSVSLELASPGKDCVGCRVRHVCPAYLAAAPRWWHQYPDGVDRLSNDVWGTVLDVIGTGPVDMVLCDAAGRRVRIDRLDSRHRLTRDVVGKPVWIFGLEATGATIGFDGKRFHPRSFHELPRDKCERQAWTVHVFGTDSAIVVNNETKLEN